jgi:hypothetical protein
MKKTLIAGIVALWAIVVGSYATQIHNEQKFGHAPKPIVMAGGTSCTTTTTTTSE